MDRERRDQILEEAIDIGPVDVAAFLDASCGNDSELRLEVERILAKRQHMQGFLEQPAATWTLSALEPGATLGRYVIEELIGTGGMSFVYRAQDTGIGRTVAIKVLTSFIPNGGRESPFSAEVKILGRIKHPNIVQIFDVGQTNGVPYIVMDYLRGRDLAKIIADGQCGDYKWKLSIARQLASALLHVHQAGIVHRDVKPANVFVGPDGAVTLMDFGISRLDHPSLTRTAGFVGTPEYIPPEYLLGHRATIRSDIYSYGILLFELFAEQKAFTGSTAEILYRAVHHDLSVEPLQTRGTPRPLIALIRAATRKDPADRPSDFSQLLQRLDLVADGKSGQSHHRFGPFIPAALLCCAIIVALTVSWVQLHAPVQNSGTPQAAEAAPLAQIPTPRPAHNAQQSPLGTSSPLSRAVSHETAPKKQMPEEAVGKRAARPGLDKLLSSAFLNRNSLPVTTPVPPPSIPFKNDALSATGPETFITGNLPSAPPLTEPTTNTRSQRAVAQSQVIATLRQYANAYNSKDLSAMRVLFPALGAVNEQKLQSAFRVAREVNLQLSPEGQPQINVSPNGTMTATVRCRRLISMIPVSGRAPKPREDHCQFGLKRLEGGAWQITSQTE